MDIVVKKHFESRGHKSPVYGLSQFRDGKILAGGGEGWISLWKIDNPENGQLYASADTSVFCLAYHAARKLILAGDRKGVLYFIDDTAKVVKKLAHRGEVFGIIVCGETALTIGKDGWLVKWDLSVFQALESLQLSDNSLRSVVLSTDGKSVWVGDSNGVIHCVSIDQWLEKHSFHAHNGTVFSLELNQSGNLISGGKDAHLKLWSLSPEPELLTDHPAHWSSVYAIKRHPSLPLLATASRSKEIRIWNSENLDPILTIDYARYQGHIRSVNNLLWVDDGRYLVSTGDDTTIIFWEFGYVL